MRLTKLTILFTLFLFGTIHSQSLSNSASGSYTLVVEGFDWGPAVNKVILDIDHPVSEVNASDFVVHARRSTDLTELSPQQSIGERPVLSAYISDNKGNSMEEGSNITLILHVGPRQSIGSPFQYARNEKINGNFWVDYELVITNTSTLDTWNKKKGLVMPLVDSFDLDGTFTHDGVSLTYASFTPTGNKSSYPLIIWLHGGGEGGTDTTIPLLGNRAANYASEDIQVLFDGAYVLAPQAPTYWMHKEGGGMTRGDGEDIYNESLMALIKDFVSTHPAIDPDRIYLGGCSNGGYMSLKLILKNPDYFAAGYISALAYFSEFVSDAQIRSIRKVPIWFMQSKDDPITIPDSTVVPIYKRLKAAGAKNVHFSFFDHVVDITGQYGGEGYHYSGHWSWVYSHANLARLDFDGKPVLLKGKPTTVMEWMAAQSK